MKNRNEQLRAKKRRPYVKPACTSELVFERTSLGCGSPSENPAPPVVCNSKS